MMIEEEDIGAVVFGYSLQLGSTIAPSASNNRDDLEKHFDDTQPPWSSQSCERETVALSSFCGWTPHWRPE